MDDDREGHGLFTRLPKFSQSRFFWGVMALVFTGLHAAHYLAVRQPWELLWACPVGCVLIGFGLLFRVSVLNAVGFLWLVVGVPFWLLTLLGGHGTVRIGSLLVHVGGLMLGLYGLRVVGVPRGAWWKALAALAALQLLSRWLTPPAANVNLAFSVWRGWEVYFPSHIGYLAFIYAFATVVFVAVEWLAERWLSPREQELQR